METDPHRHGARRWQAHKRVFSFHFIQKILGFGLSFCKMKLNIMQNFWQKGIYSLFWILASRGQKNQKAKKLSPTL